MNEIVFDTETTGLDTAVERVVEFGAIGQSEHHHYINPGIPIPKEASDIHGITDEKVANAPSFKALADDIATLLTSKTLVGYNAASYDVAILNAEFERHGHSFRLDPTRVLDPVIFVRHHLRHLRSRKLGDMCLHFGVVLDQAHTAVADATATRDMLGVMRTKGLIPLDVEEALKQQAVYTEKQRIEFEKWSYWFYEDRKTGVLCMGAGKHCGLPLVNVDVGYITFMLTKIPDLDPGARVAFEDEVARRRRQGRPLGAAAYLRRGATR